MNPQHHLRPTLTGLRPHAGLLKKAFALAALATALPSFALTCNELQAEVEAKIRNSGVTQFTITIADTNAAVPGKVVGTCEMGSKKLLYTAVSSPVSTVATAQPTVSPQPKTEVMVTECKDGSASMGGDCKR